MAIEDLEPSELAALEQRLGRAEHRAANARRHAADARELARADAARGDGDAEILHMSEASAHEGAARVIEQTAALYRARIRHLSDSAADPSRVSERSGRPACLEERRHGG